jgi:S-DNA-T family DNA segregation ATPase FtsK/SpoIIIE
MEAYNKKAEQYLKEGRSFKRRVHTGYDPENGEAMYEEEQITPERLPFIVPLHTSLHRFRDHNLCELFF